MVHMRWCFVLELPHMKAETHTMPYVTHRSNAFISGRDVTAFDSSPKPKQVAGLLSLEVSFARVQSCLLPAFYMAAFSVIKNIHESVIPRSNVQRK